MKHVKLIHSSECWLQIGSICSIRNPSRNRDYLNFTTPPLTYSVLVHVVSIQVDCAPKSTRPIVGPYYGAVQFGTVSDDFPEKINFTLFSGKISKGTYRVEKQLKLLATNRLYMFHWNSFQKRRYFQNVPVPLLFHVIFSAYHLRRHFVVIVVSKLKVFSALLGVIFLDLQFACVDARPGRLAPVQ